MDSSSGPYAQAMDADQRPASSPPSSPLTDRATGLACDRTSERCLCRPDSAPPAVPSVARAEHAVHFYASDSSLLDEVSAYLAKALDADGTVAAIATKAHREGLEQRLQARGCDLRSAASGGRYLSHDASETLSRILVAVGPTRPVSPK